jgi:hypothetical protein
MTKHIEIEPGVFKKIPEKTLIEKLTIAAADEFPFDKEAQLIGIVGVLAGIVEKHDKEIKELKQTDNSWPDCGHGTGKG